jgi:hypothetical protein
LSARLTGIVENSPHYDYHSIEKKRNCDVEHADKKTSSTKPITDLSVITD